MMVHILAKVTKLTEYDPEGYFGEKFNCVL